MLGSVIFVQPWILGFLAGLPLLWWLLRLLPPSPKKVIFPALALLRELEATAQTPARTPLWLLLLRFLIVTLLILSLAGPQLETTPVVPGTGVVLIAIDNDWAAARTWDMRREAMQRLIEQAESEKRDVLFLPTAPPANGESIESIGPVAAKAAYAVAARLMPVPWPADWKQAKSVLEKIEHDQIAYSVWLNSGLGGKNAEAFFESLKSYSPVSDARILGDPQSPIYVLAAPKSESDSRAFSLYRAATGVAETLAVSGKSVDGQVLARAPVTFTAGAPHAWVKLEMPLDVHNRIARIEVEGIHTAASTLLLDNDWQRPTVGLVGDKSEEAEHSLLSSLFYIDRALKPFADTHIDRLETLLALKPAIIIVTDSAPMEDTLLPKLAEWIKSGGVLLRFAGDRLAGSPRPQEAELLPVVLRTGDRAMGGTMSWATPQKLQEFRSGSPFEGITIPPDVSVSRQLLAEPTADLAKKTWATLNDGTPLVTAKPLGAGLTILFHVPARSEWSNLPLSGLFVDMLRRLLLLSHMDPSSGVHFVTLVPQQALDAFGDLQQAGAAARPIENTDLARVELGPSHPPGYYGGEGFRRALNLGSFLGQPEAWRGATPESYQVNHSRTDLAPWILVTAFLLFFIDFILSLWLRGLLRLRRLGKALPLLIPLLFWTTPVSAANDDKAAIELTSKTYLAFIETGNASIDRVSEAGLKGLARVLQRRTSLDEIGVIGVNPESDDLVFFPLLYWPLTPLASALSPPAAQRVNDYLRHGGMILFDTGLNDSDLPVQALGARLTGISIPPLARIPDNHVLHRSFYLLDQFPGRNAGGDLWLEPQDIASYDGVASVIAGNGGWAGAWAVDDKGRYLFPCTPDGELQREFAYRFGVNVVIYALTGNYKSDQLHAQALLERLG